MTGHDSLIGVRDCGCITAWMDIAHSTKAQTQQFYREMGASNREVRKANLEDVRDQIGYCEHREEPS